MVFIGYWINSGCDFYPLAFFCPKHHYPWEKKLPLSQGKELICCEYLILQDQHRISVTEEPVFVFIAFYMLPSSGRNRQRHRP